MIFTKRLNKAMQIAALAHSVQSRKGSHIPYISHPFAVMTIARSETDDEDTLVACLLHDVLEDVPERYGKEDMRNDFGDKVVTIVEGVTKNNSLPSWQDQADAYLQHLRHSAPPESVLISAADKYHNLLSIITDYEEIGDELWKRFSAGQERQIWWYTAIGEVLASRIPNMEITKDYLKLLEKMPSTVD